MRSKTDYIQSENDRGKTEIRKVGLAPVQREGMDYEFSTVFDIASSHMATVSKDRTRLFRDMPFVITPQIGKALHEWLNADTNTTQK